MERAAALQMELLSADEDIEKTIGALREIEFSLHAFNSWIKKKEKE